MNPAASDTFAGAGWERFGGDPVVTTRAAERLREAGDLAGATALLTRLTQVFPHLPYGWRELAVLHRREGDGASAAAGFERALAVDPGNLLTLTQTVRHLAGQGRLDDADAKLSAFRPQDRRAERRTRLLRQLVAFMRRHPLEATLARVAAMRTRPHYLGVADVEARIAAALAARRPLSLIRLGDGEGAWITDPAEEDGQFGELHRRNRKRILRTWFGDDTLIDRPDFLAVRGRLLAAIEAAAIVGVTYPERIRHEYAIASFDGLPCCVNVLRHVEPRDPGGPTTTQAVTTHDIHLDLHLSGAFRRLTTAGAPVGLISCHPDLAAAVAARMGGRIGASLLVPEEKRFSDVIGPNGMTQPHFPRVFACVVARLRERDWTGMLWLVAAGYLGKIYCHEIAQAGGVAVDIGSVADAWSGKATRPGFGDLEAYRL